MQRFPHQEWLTSQNLNGVLEVSDRFLLPKSPSRAASQIFQPDESVRSLAPQLLSGQCVAVAQSHESVMFARRSGDSAH
jgi:hypothetical protein